MENRIEEISRLLHQAGETHHQVFAFSDGDDPDWASWYSDWLVNHSPLVEALGSQPVRSELTYMLVGLDKEFNRTKPGQPWEEFYATKLQEHFAPSK